MGYAADEKRAMEAVRSLQPDGILLDATMAASDDFDLVRRLSGPTCSGASDFLETAMPPPNLSGRSSGVVSKNTELVAADLQRYFSR